MQEAVFETGGCHLSEASQREARQRKHDEADILCNHTSGESQQNRRILAVSTESGLVSAEVCQSEGVL